MEGVLRTRVGYAGGTMANPTYHNLGDHTETLQIDFDPEQVTYSELLEVFWEAHNPTSRPWSKQYMSLVLYHNAAQAEQARAVKFRRESDSNKRLFTEIRSFEHFYPAEDYHQKYYLQAQPLFMRELRAYYPHFQDIVDSTAAARINGFLAGYGSVKSLSEAEMEYLGLSPAVRTR